MNETYQGLATWDEQQNRKNSYLIEPGTDSMPISATAMSNRTTNSPFDMRLDLFQDEENSSNADIDEEAVPLTPRGPQLEEHPSTPLSDRCHVVRSRSSSSANNNVKRKRKREGVKRRRGKEILKDSGWVRTCLLWFCRNTRAVQSTISCMNLLARLLFWSSILASILGVFWYSYELYNHG